MSWLNQSRRRGRVPVVVACLLLAAGAIATPTVAAAKPKAAKHHTVRTHHKRARRMLHAASPKPAAAGETCTPTAATPGAIDAATQAFMAHLYAAHLSSSPADQVNAILSNPSNYVLIHTALVEAMMQTGVASFTNIGSTLQAVTIPFFAHIYSAHLSQSPEQQVQAIVSNPDAYVLLHTVWAQSMLSPLTSWFETLLGGTPGTDCPGGGTGGTGGTTSGGGTSGGGTPPPPAAKSVMIMNYAFTPSTLTVPAGTKVTWSNMDSVPHTVTSSGSGPLSSPNIAPGTTWSYTFTTPGTYHYYCAVHPNMTATVTVQ